MEITCEIYGLLNGAEYSRQNALGYTNILHLKPHFCQSVNEKLIHSVERMPPARANSPI